MVAQSEAVMAMGVALVMGAGIAAMTAVNGGRLGGGGGLDRARGASTILLKGTASSSFNRVRRPRLQQSMSRPALYISEPRE